ncbi:glycosyltransferase family A protein [Bacteroides fluxus]|uniref:glycosyltransferase family A protein n=1 Tax=Bacteroides fluxus TaxID=626930 RepID=UPI002A819E14|nr:glycosyltransferase family A protein [Bacteroides fluxus]MDY3789691.1 glycosyltransferase family A protein [Bacteroides fluxus]
MKYDLIFISTCTVLDHVHNLLSSIANNNKSLKVCVVTLFQCGLDSDVIYDTPHSVFVKLKYGELCGLSKARNIGIRYVREFNLVASYVMFPDDDSTFDKEFFDNFKNEVHSDTLINVFCEGTRSLYQKMPQLSYLEKTDNYLNAMSVNMIIQYDHFMEVGFFDERMGVGAKYGAGEDGDFFLRICEQFGPFVFNQHLHTFHPALNTKFAVIPLKDLIIRYKKYGEGVIFLLCKHKKYRHALLCATMGLLGAFKALLVNFDGKLCFARMAGFYYRSKMLVTLFTK